VEKRILTLLVVLLLGCGLPKSREIVMTGQPLGKRQRSRLLVATSDYLSKGGVASIDFVSGEVTKLPLPTHSDALLRSPVGQPWAFVINRLGADNVQKVSKDGIRFYPECKVGDLTNPQDVIEASKDLLYVSRLNKSKELLLLNPETCQTESGPMLDKFADADGFPEMGFLYRTPTQILIQLRRLKSNDPLLPPAGNGVIAVLEIESNRLSKIDLTFANPVTPFRAGPDGNLYIGSAGFVGAQSKLDGGIEKVDLNALKSLGPIVEEGVLGGDIWDFDFLGPETGIAIVQSGDKDRLVSFNSKTGERDRIILEASGFSLAQLLVDRERNLLFVAHRDPLRPRIRVFDLETLMEKEDLFFEVGLPPVWMELTD